MANQVMTTGAQASAIIPAIWSKRSYDVLLTQLPWESCISKDYEGEIAALGNTVKIHTVPEFSAATEDVEGTANDADAVTVTNQDLVINKRIVKDFILTSNVLLQSLPLMDKLRELAIFAIMKKIQANLIVATVPSAAAPDHQIAYTTALTLALVDILAAKELMDLQEVPFMSRYMVMGAAALNDIFNFVGFVSSDYITSGAPLQTGELPPALLGFTPKFANAAGASTYLFHSSYMTMATQHGMSVKEYDLGVQGTRGTRVNVDLVYGQKQLDAKRVVQIS
jgi:hypothetical protein